MLGSVYRVRHTATIVGAFDDPIAVIDNGFAPLWRRAQHGFEGKAPGLFAGVAPAPAVGRCPSPPGDIVAGPQHVCRPCRRGILNGCRLFPNPMLATLGEAPSGEGWAFEFKWDGAWRRVAGAEPVVAVAGHLNGPVDRGGRMVALPASCQINSKYGTLSERNPLCRTIFRR